MACKVGDDLLALARCFDALRANELARRGIDVDACVVLVAVEEDAPGIAALLECHGFFAAIHAMDAIGGHAQGFLKASVGVHLAIAATSVPFVTARIVVARGRLANNLLHVLGCELRIGLQPQGDNTRHGRRGH